MTSTIKVVLFVLVFNSASATIRTVTAPYSGIFTGNTEEIAIPQSSSNVVRYANVTRFLGVPYAKPPTGDLRFRKSEARDVMTSAYDATIQRPLCPQTVGMDSAVKYFNVSEDCLYLNIFVPGNRPSNIPVLVWIHGGSFYTGGAYYYSGDILSVHGDIIVVVVQYRLNAFGFLSDGSPGSGNMGLWDQSLALTWVQRNIADFGGDPSNVTVSGQSAGAASALYQATCMYQHNKGNFHRVIAQSGTHVSTWALQRSPQTVFRKFANETRCNTVNMTAAFDCIKGKSMSELLAIAEKTDGLLPVIDGTFIENDPQRTQEFPSRLRDMDLLIGSASLDGYRVFQSVLQSTQAQYGININDGVTKSFFEQVFIPRSLALMSGTNASKAFISSAIREYSTSSASDDNPAHFRDKMIEFLTDWTFKIPALIVANAHSTGNFPGRTFAYEFDYRPYYSVLENRPSWQQGSLHGDDVGFVFGFVDNLQVLLGFPPDYVSPYPVPATDRALSEAMMTLWAEFVKRGDPNPGSTPLEWPEYNSSSGAYFAFNSNTTTSNKTNVQHHLATPSRVKFWEKIVPCFIRHAAENTRDECTCDTGGDKCGGPVGSAGGIRPIYPPILIAVYVVVGVFARIDLYLILTH